MSAVDQDSDLFNKAANHPERLNILYDQKVIDATVRLHDLKILVRRYFGTQVRKRAEINVRYESANKDSSAANEFEYKVAQATPCARKYVEERYRFLFEALESGDDVAGALAAFLNQD